MKAAALKHLAVAVRLYDGRYHGTGEWRPSPARLFQALVAAAAPLRTPAMSRALEWLETLRPPIVGVPTMVRGQRVQTFVPHNDSDALGGDLRRVEEIRAAKTIHPTHFDPTTPFLYVWSFEDSPTGTDAAHEMMLLAERLYQFGRGIDMAWASAEVLDDAALGACVARYQGAVLRPAPGSGERSLPCPESGSLASLDARHEASTMRFRSDPTGPGKQLFIQPPKARFAQVAYASPPSRQLFELRSLDVDGRYQPWPLARVTALVTWLRDGAIARLAKAMPSRTAEIERALVGRRPDGTNDGPSSARVRLVPLPSIGHEHADRRIRRVLVEIPTDCSLRAEDVAWAFSGLVLSDPATGEVSNTVLTPASDGEMAARYGVGSRACHVWRTVTPAALPEGAGRRRIDPAQLRKDAKGGAERQSEHARATAAVHQALRHTEVVKTIAHVRVQREPFDARGARAESFARGTRFSKERLWHVEVAFHEPPDGPLVIGDGRFLGLGVMQQIQRTIGVHAFSIESGDVDSLDPLLTARALRRAVMYRVQQTLGPQAALPSFFSGHDADGAPARSPHLIFALDPARRRVLVLAPHLVEHRLPRGHEQDKLNCLERALSGLRELNVGGEIVLALRERRVDVETDPLFMVSRTWRSLTSYQATRHERAGSASAALATDLRAECRRMGLPAPDVTYANAQGVPKVGLVGDANLTFKVAVMGPVILGKNRHQGGGVFTAVPPKPADVS